jgi:hypothetical protein
MSGHPRLARPVSGAVLVVALSTLLVGSVGAGASALSRSYRTVYDSPTARWGHHHWMRSPSAQPTPTSSTPSAQPSSTAPTLSPSSSTPPSSAPPPSTPPSLSPSTPPSSTPPPGGTGSSGEAINATNTGLAGAGVAASSLVTTAGTTYGSAFDGQTISGKLFTGRVNISGNNITLKNCKVLTGGPGVYGIDITGDNDTVRNCDVSAPPGTSLYEPIFLSASSDAATVTRNNISRGENLLTTYATHAQITENYLHDVALDSNPGDHPDGIEIYGGGPVLIAANRIEEDNLYDSPINTAPWGTYTLTDLTVADNFLDGGQSMTLIDNQNSNGYLRNTRILGNVMGGHTNPDTNMSFGIYKALNNADRRPIVQTETQLAANPNAILWPTTGTDTNHWGECTGLTPDRTGQITLPD